MKKLFKKTKKITFLVLVGLIFTKTFLIAATMGDLLRKTGEGAQFKTADQYTASEQIGSIISYALSFLGVIFVVLIIYGGFLWMAARGEDDQVTKAKDIMKNSIIGLIIVLSADVITYYIINGFISGSDSSTPTFDSDGDLEL